MTARPPLVERDEEIFGLLDAVTDIDAGNGVVRLLTGPVGSGKSALLGALCDEAAAAGTTVLRAAGSQAEQDTPLGVVDQLLRHPGLTALRSGPVSPADLSHATQQTSELSGPLFELCRSEPLLVCVDDVHLADQESWRFLMYLVRRIGTARIAVVLTERTSRQHPQPGLRAELVGQSHCVTVPLGPLTEHGVAQLIRGRLGTRATPELVTTCAMLAGGSPLLAHALADDLADAARRAPDAPQAWPGAGDAFLQAVLGCLCRSEEPALAVARAIALLGDRCDLDLLERFLSLPPALAENTVHALETAGLLADRGFRGGAVRRAVLLHVEPGELSRLQYRTARLLYDHGAPENDVAERLLLTNETCDAWSVEVLCDAARQALAEGDGVRARRCADHALTHSPDDRHRAEVLTMLAGIEWQTHPGNAVRHLPALVTAVRSGELDAGHGIDVATYLLRHGRATDAEQVLSHLFEESGKHEVGAETSAGLWLLRRLAATSHPGTLRHLPPLTAVGARDDGSSALVRADPRLQSAAVLTDVLGGSADENGLLGAEQVLRGTSLTYRSWEKVEFALLALLYSDRTERAEAACDRLLERLDGAAGRGWRPPLMVLRSHIALRRGRPGDAERYARTALDEMPAQAWGTTIGMPLSSLLAALTVMGRYDEAAELLDRPVPHSLYETRHGLHYLHARGEFKLATGNAQSAAEDLLICGDLMRAWDMDLPGLVPWRSSAARALLRLGKRQQAVALVEEEMRLLPPGPSRARGIALRASAAVGELKNRPSLLREAVRELQRCDDLAEEAAALADLGFAYQSLGDNKRSRAMMNRAWHGAKRCGAEPLCRELSGLFPERPSHEWDASGAVAAPVAEALPEGLSEAELRVASLAAMGHTNREISRELFITVSTVEQHLTRVYRKLNVGKRGELLDRLGLVAPGGAATA